MLAVYVLLASSVKPWLKFDTISTLAEISSVVAECSYRRRDLRDHVRHLADHHHDAPQRLAGAAGELDAARHLFAALLHRKDHALGVLLDRADHVGDLLGRLRRALGQLAHLVGHDGKAPSLIARARRLDGRVERQQVGLVGDVLDDLDDRP